MSDLVAGRWTSAAAALEPEWRALFHDDPAATPFSSPGWGLPWLRHWAGAQQPWIVTVRDGSGALAGLAPLVLGKRGPSRVLYALGSVVGNYWDVIARPADRADVLDAVADHLRREGGKWDGMVLDRLPPGSATPAHLAAAGLRVRDRPPVIAPAIALPESFDDFLGGLSRNARSKIRRHLRRVDEGEVTVGTTDDPRALPGLVDEWQRLRVEWWRARAREMNPEHGSERFRAFTAETMAALVGDRRGLVKTFEQDGRTVGITLDFVDSGVYYSWLKAFDPAFRDLRPGQLAIAHAIRDAVGRGLHTYDFMIGTEPYKYDYGAQDRALGWIVVTNGRPRSRASAVASAVLDRARSTGPDEPGPPAGRDRPGPGASN